MVVIFSHVSTTGYFIHNTGLDLNSVKSTPMVPITTLGYNLKSNTISFDELPAGYSFLTLSPLVVLFIIWGSVNIV